MSEKTEGLMVTVSIRRWVTVPEAAVLWLRKRSLHFQISDLNEDDVENQKGVVCVIPNLVLSNNKPAPSAYFWISAVDYSVQETVTTYLKKISGKTVFLTKESGYEELSVPNFFEEEKI